MDWNGLSDEVSRPAQKPLNVTSCCFQSQHDMQQPWMYKWRTSDVNNRTGDHNSPVGALLQIARQIEAITMITSYQAPKAVTSSQKSESYTLQSLVKYVLSTYEYGVLLSHDCYLFYIIRDTKKYNIMNETPTGCGVIAFYCIICPVNILKV